MWVGGEGEPGEGWGQGVLAGGWGGRMPCGPSYEVEDSQLWWCSEIRGHQRGRGLGDCEWGGKGNPGRVGTGHVYGRLG